MDFWTLVTVMVAASIIAVPTAIGTKILDSLAQAIRVTTLDFIDSFPHSNP